MSAADIFGKSAVTSTRYRVTIQFRNLIVGGIPSDKSVIEGWIRSRMELGDAAIDDLVATTVQDRGVLSPDDAVALVMASDLAPSVNGFKRHPDTGELCIEGRIVKAALKEWMNSSYPGTEWPGKAKYLPTKKGDASLVKKGLMKYAAEAVIVPPENDLISLGVTQPTRVEERIKHVMTPQGPRSSINRVEVVYRPRITFNVDVRDDFLPPEAWGRIWATGEGIGLGSDRGRSDGMFELEEWVEVPAAKAVRVA